jgi:hypothetical protein
MTMTMRVARVAAVVAGLAMTNLDAARANAGHPLADRCELFRLTGVEDPSSETCLRCHGSGGALPGSNHPVDMDYESAAARSRGSMLALRPIAEVVARGVFLPDGQIRCVTCHDGRSPWKYGIALPSGAKVKPAVNPRDPTTYEDGPALRAREAELLTSNERYSIAVGTKPLCLVCHAID